MSFFLKLTGPAGSEYTYCLNLTGRRVADDAVRFLGWVGNKVTVGEQEQRSQNLPIAQNLGSRLGEQNHGLIPYFTTDQGTSPFPGEGLYRTHQSFSRETFPQKNLNVDFLRKTLGK